MDVIRLSPTTEGTAVVESHDEALADSYAEERSCLLRETRF